MTTIKETLFSILSGNAGVSAIVAARIYPAFPPQGATLPCISYTRIGGGSDLSLSGDEGRSEALFQIDCFAENPLTSEQLAAAVKTCLHGYATAPIERCSLENETDLDDADLGQYRASLDFRLMYR